MIREHRVFAEESVLVLAPTGRDAALTQSILEQSGVTAVGCTTLADLCDRLERGAAALLLVEEAVEADKERRLDHWLRDQPHWSDLPVLILARPGADSASVARAMDRLGNVTVLERPVRVASLVSTVRTALRARERQYQTRAHLSRLEENERELRDTHRRKDEFLAVLAHELRNPLAPIRNSLHILRLTRQHDPASERVGEMMERQVNHMVRLVDDLMEVSRITGGKIELRKESVNIATVMQNAIETSQPLIDHAELRLIVRLPAEPVLLEGDPVRLAQVFANLLNNAAKYTDPGGEILLIVTREGNDIVARVRDTGTGIPPSMLPRIFDLFTQVDRQSGRAQGGLGIGLTLVKNLVELHGGSVRAYSDGPGRGSEFVVRLPVATARPRTIITDAPTDPLASRVPRRILVVDDNHDAAESLGMLLHLSGADVQVVFDGPSALHAMKAYNPSVVVLDIGMPGMDGYEVARRIRADPQFGQVTLIALTGWGQEADRRSTMAAGFDYHLIKPADINALQALLASLDPVTQGLRA